MWKDNAGETAQRPILLAASVIILVIAFIQCYRMTHDLIWPSDPDFHRDMSFVHGALAGHFGQDPIYSGQYLWYNPMVFSIETLLVRISGQPINIIVIRAGLYLNLLGPLCFFGMAWGLFNLRIATMALLSYLFLATGDIEGTAAATYSPWLYPATFAQFFFYVNILLCYKAFSAGKFVWFLLLGITLGLSFLAHTAPTVMIILILVSLLAGNFWQAWRGKDFPRFKPLFLQGMAVLGPFLLVTLPFLYYIVGKYHLHIINRFPSEWRPFTMQWYNWRLLLKNNLSVSLFVSVIGFIAFYRTWRERLQRRIIGNWLIISILMYVYATSVPGIRDKFHLQLPVIVPNYHYWFYLKALQSLFFGFGAIFLLDLGLRRLATSASPRYATFLTAAVIEIAIAYFPIYKERRDFTRQRADSLSWGIEKKDRIEAYYFIEDHVPVDKVILCPEPESNFPVLASGRKMVCVNSAFSNPYLDFYRRWMDDSAMVDYLQTGQPVGARRLFDEYQVSFVFLPNKTADSSAASPLLGAPLLRTTGYTLFPIRKQVYRAASCWGWAAR